MSAVAQIIRHVLEGMDDAEGYKDVSLPDNVRYRDDPEFFQRLRRNPPEGAIGHLSDWNITSIVRRCTYRAEKRANGRGCYWKQLDNGVVITAPRDGYSWSDDYIELP